MKQITFLSAAAVMAVVLLCGCDNTPVGWLKTDGGYINLSQVCNIESYCVVKSGDKTLLSGAMSEENIKEVRSALKKMDKSSQIELQGFIKFDKDYVMTLTESKTVPRDEAMKIIDAWEDVMDRIAEQLP